MWSKGKALKKNNSLVLRVLVLWKSGLLTAGIPAQFLMIQCRIPEKNWCTTSIFTRKKRVGIISDRFLQQNFSFHLPRLEIICLVNAVFFVFVLWKTFMTSLKYSHTFFYEALSQRFWVTFLLFDSMETIFVNLTGSGFIFTNMPETHKDGFLLTQEGRRWVR